MPPKRKKAAPSATTESTSTSTSTSPTNAKSGRVTKRQKSAAAEPEVTAAPAKATKATGKGRGRKSGLPSASPFDSNRMMEWFNHYRECGGEDDMIDCDGVIQLATDLGIAVEGRTMLAIAWKLNASKMGFFTQQEWVEGMTRMQVDMIDKLREKLAEFEKLFGDLDSLREMYRWAFTFSKVDAQRTIDLQVAMGLWKLLLEDGRFHHVDAFCEFLEEKAPVKVINKDQWGSFFDFSMAVEEDLSTYDDTHAWPVLFDEYVEWRRAKLVES
ncbi:DCN1-like protein 4 [Blyttiomyces sp. JEL0837]|nr:DCN1-like protein 4 [Blyttiomyces sp. JEL0837]